MMCRRFLNLVVENLDTGLYSLRRLNLANNLFYPSTAAAEAAMAQSEAAVKANAERQAGYKHGIRFLQATASSLGQLPAATINFRPSGPSTPGDVPLDVVTLLGDESKILCADTIGRTSLYDADSHAVVTVPDLRSSKGRDAIAIRINGAAYGRAANQGDSLYVISRTPDPDRMEECFEVLRHGSGQDIFSEHQLLRGWSSLPPPPFLYDSAYDFPADIGAFTVVGDSNIYISSVEPEIGTYCFNTVNWKWMHAGKWTLPFFGRAEYDPEHNLWFGLSASRPFNLCASDLSAMEFEQPPVVLQTFVDFDMPKSWSPFHLDLINLGSGKFCVVKFFHSTQPRGAVVDFSDREDDDEEVYDYPDVINWEFAVMIGVEVRCYGEAPPGKLKIIRHKSRYHTFKDNIIHWVL